LDFFVSLFYTRANNKKQETPGLIDLEHVRELEQAQTEGRASMAHSSLAAARGEIVDKTAFDKTKFDKTKFVKTVFGDDGSFAKPSQVQAQPRRGILRRLIDAMMASRQRAAERLIVDYLAARGGRMTDETEREIERRFLRQPGASWLD
jgi:hypothetical protein